MAIIKMRLLRFIHSDNKQSLSIHHVSGTTLDAEGNMRNVENILNEINQTQ